MRKVDCPGCRLPIILEATTSEGDVILCPHCGEKLAVSGFSRRPIVQRIDLVRST